MRRIDLPLVCLAFSLGAFAGEDTVSLSGKWRFQLDRADAGLAEQWSTQTLPGTIKLPGGLSEQGVGDPVTVDTKWTGGIVDKSWFTAPEFAEYRKPGNVKVPFWLQPERYYAGAAWFQRGIVIPAEWEGKRVVLFLERPHWETRVWVDGRPVGTNNALATPHEYDLGCVGQASRLSQTGNGDRHDASPAVLTPGKHTLTLRVDNRLIVDVGENSHSVSDHTQGNWNGIVGRIE
ncbi:MAG TPA: sugar-binding domain-containing protein, partial [Verrucomicrobiae bacterium]